MDNVLLVDIGNTSVKWALTAANNELEMSQQYYPRDISETFFIKNWERIKKTDKLIVSCVASDDTWQAVEEAADTLWKIKPERVVSKTKGYGLINAYAKPSDLGSDRWCALIAAYHMTNSDIVVIDCGTAITVDIANKSGEHLGGYILPGLGMMKQSLGIHTAQININNSVTVDNVLSPANTTSGCIDAGVYLAAVSFVEAVIRQQQKRTNNLKCYLTGGDADLLAEYLTSDFISMPNLILHGLAYVAEHKEE